VETSRDFFFFSKTTRPALGYAVKRPGREGPALGYEVKRPGREGLALGYEVKRPGREGPALGYEVKRPGREVVHSPPSSAEWSNTSYHSI